MTIQWEQLGPVPPPGGGASPETSLATDDHLRQFLVDASGAGQPILLLINDPHRPTQTTPILQGIARCVGLLDSSPRFRALVATGTHRFTGEQERAFESAVFSTGGLTIEQIDWHRVTDTADISAMAGAGLHRWLAEHSFLLPIGSVEPHYFAGVTGPHKTLTVGCMTADDIERNHAHALSPESDTLRLHGNPVFDGIMAVANEMPRHGKRVLAIGQVLCGDQIVGIATGDCQGVLNALMPVVQQVYVRTTAAPADLLELRVPAPLGRHFYQADKALKNNHRAVRDGGGIVLVADCEEGIGPDAFLRVLRNADSYERARQLVQRDGYRLGDHKAVKLRHLMDSDGRHVRVVLVSSHLPREALAGTGIDVFTNREKALAFLVRTVSPPLLRGLIIEDAGMVTSKASGHL